MFALMRVASRAFVLGVIVGVLFAPRSGAETRRMLNERFASIVNEFLEIAALPPIEPARARTDGHPERPPLRRPKAAVPGDAGSSGSGAGTTS